MLYLTALATLASILLYFYFGVCVGKARVQLKIPAPATTGDPLFERLYRVQMNTLEWMVIYLPCLWLFGFYVSDSGAGLLGLAWIVGRYLYKRGYEASPEQRGRGFVIQAGATAILFFGVLFNILARIAVGD
jgi:glutathione S-transferase